MHSSKKNKQQQIEDILKTCADNFSSDYFSIIKLNGKTPEIKSNYPIQWLERYNKKKYWTFDPAIYNSSFGHDPCVWGENNISAKDIVLSRVIMEARGFSINSGITTKVPALSGNKYILTFSSQKESQEYIQDFLPTAFAHTVKYGMILEKVFDESVSMPDLELINSYIKYDGDIYKKIERSHQDSVEVLDTLYSEVSYSAHSSVLDRINFLIHQLKKKITNPY